MVSCGFDSLFQKMNTRFSDWSWAGGMLTKLGVQFALFPLENVQSPVYKAYYQISNGIANKNYEYIGTSLTLFLSQLMSDESGETDFQLPSIG